MSLFHFLFFFFFLAHSSASAARLSIQGSVYCDACYDNTFSNHSYFLPGVDVNVECKLKSSSEEISFSVNRSTDIYGMYAVDIPSVDCSSSSLVSFCQATLIGRPLSAAAAACTLPATKAVATETNGCTHTLGTLSFRPPRRNTTLCSLNASKFFLPYVCPFPFPPNPPSLPFPFPPIPPLAPPSPPFNFGDPRTWIPQLPQPPPPPVFNFWDPNTWIPHPPPKNR